MRDDEKVDVIALREALSRQESEIERALCKKFGLVLDDKVKLSSEIKNEGCKD